MKKFLIAMTFLAVGVAGAHATDMEYLTALQTTEFGRKAFEFQTSALGKLFEDATLAKAGYTMKRVDGQDYLYRQSDGKRLSLDESGPVIDEIFMNMMLEFYQQNQSLYAKDYEELKRIDAKYRPSTSAELVILPEIDRRGQIDVNDFKRKFQTIPAVGGQSR